MNSCRPTATSVGHWIRSSSARQSYTAYSFRMMKSRTAMRCRVSARAMRLAAASRLSFTSSMGHSLARPAHSLERLVDAAVGRNGDEALVRLPCHVHLLREVEEDVGRIGHQELGELRIVALALRLTAGAPRRLDGLVHLGVLVVGEVASLPLARMPDRVREGIGIVEIGPGHDDRLEVRREELLHEGRPVERFEARLGAAVLQV